MEEVRKGEVWWSDLPEPRRSEPGFRRPVLIVQANAFNRSRLNTVIVAVITGNLEIADAPGNVFLPARISGLPRDSVVNVSQLLSLDRMFLAEFVSELPLQLKRSVDEGLRTVLGL